MLPFQAEVSVAGVLVLVAAAKFPTSDRRL
jgi:hypothetical protein